jgi:hypothetical protein
LIELRTLLETHMSDTPRQEGNRPKIGPVQGDPVTTHPDLDKLTPYQRGLREALRRELRTRKVKNFVQKQVKYINGNRQVIEEIKILFDENGQPPANAPLEDIMAERRQLEYQIKWFEAMVLELQTRLLRVREIEALALDVLEHSPES